jgi:hypothetical protein
MNVLSIFKVPEHHKPKTAFEYNYIKFTSFVLGVSIGMPPSDSVNFSNTVVQQIKVAQIPTTSGRTFQTEYILNSIKSTFNKIVKNVAKR